MIDPIESDCRTVIDDLIIRYLADELDRRQLAEWVTILRLSGGWPNHRAFWLLMQTASHLFMFERDDWPEDPLKASLAYCQEAVDDSGPTRGSVMFGAEWLALLRAGHVPPGTTFHDNSRRSSEQRSQPAGDE